MALELQQLNASQLKSYNEFIELAGDAIKPTHKEHDLIPWLTESKFDAKKAVKMFKECMEWRDKHGIEGMLEMWSRTVPNFLWEIIGKKGLIGFDKEGCPVWLFPLGRWDFKGLLLSVYQEDIALQAVYLFERSRMEVERRASITGKVVPKVTIIIDLEHIDYSVAAWKTTWAAATRVFHIVGHYYPDSIKTMYGINAPSFFPPLYSVAKHFFHDIAKRTIQLYDKNRSKWVPALLEEIDANVLPQYWGGTCVDPDGDPMCPSKVTTTCEVPKEMYMKSLSDLGIKGMKTVSVDNGAAYQVNVEVTKDGAKLRWRIFSDATELPVKIHRKEAEVLREIDSFQLKDCYFTLMEGETTHLKAGNYVVTFDNSYFKLRVRTVSYSVTEV